MASEQLALVIIAGIWAALNTLVSVYKVVNDKRDVIVTGVYEDEKLTLEHRRLMFQNDWIPLKFGVAMASLLFSFVLVAIPNLTESNNQWIAAVSYIAALGPFFSFWAFGYLGLRDYKFIKHTLDRAKVLEAEEVKTR